jgi:glycosyltransferase A (GT-A) superfamily protein (DUF2064 family)
MEMRALLIFADSAHTDCKRRGWPSAFRSLLETQRFEVEENVGIDLHLFTTGGPQGPLSSSVRVHLQEGTTFGQRLENAIDALTRIGYQEIVIVGRDCPDLGQSDIAAAFEQLRQHRLVLGPDHRGGCYLIGIQANDREKLHGIRWQRNTDFRQILNRFGNQEVVRLCVKIDLDSLSDVWLLAGSRSPWSIVAELLRKLLATCRFFLRQTAKTYLVGNQREYWQLPPPVTQVC